MCAEGKPNARRIVGHAASAKAIKPRGIESFNEMDEHSEMLFRPCVQSTVHIYLIISKPASWSLLNAKSQRMNYESIWRNKTNLVRRFCRLDYHLNI